MHLPKKTPIRWSANLADKGRFCGRLSGVLSVTFSSSYEDPWAYHPDPGILPSYYDLEPASRVSSVIPSRATLSESDFKSKQSEHVIERGDDGLSSAHSTSNLSASSSSIESDKSPTMLSASTGPSASRNHSQTNANSSSPGSAPLMNAKSTGRSWASSRSPRNPPAYAGLTGSNSSITPGSSPATAPGANMPSTPPNAKFMTAAAGNRGTPANADVSIGARSVPLNTQPHSPPSTSGSNSPTMLNNKSSSTGSPREGTQPSSQLNSSAPTVLPSTSAPTYSYLSQPPQSYSSGFLPGQRAGLTGSSPNSPLSPHSPRGDSQPMLSSSPVSSSIMNMNYAGSGIDATAVRRSQHLSAGLSAPTLTSTSPTSPQSISPRGAASSEPSNSINSNFKTALNPNSIDADLDELASIISSQKVATNQSATQTPTLTVQPNSQGSTSSNSSSGVSSAPIIVASPRRVAPTITTDADDFARELAEFELLLNTKKP